LEDSTNTSFKEHTPPMVKDHIDENNTSTSKHVLIYAMYKMVIDLIEESNR
jgi:hypothetical protein